ncbi:MAG TPA: glycosyl transferase [Clostridium sp.]|nr:glycosyl transferase [Clostridium sp.]
MKILSKAIRKGVFGFIPDSIYLRILYRVKMKKKLNLKNPITYTEKIQWLKLNDRKREYTMYVDKYPVRSYIKQKIGGDYLIPLVGGPWKSFDDIDFSKLTDSFVLKTTHDSGGVVICPDKTKLNIKNIKKKLENSLNVNFYWQYREWPYKNVEPCIIAEQYMEDESGYELKDYKFFCFNGIPRIMFIASDRNVQGKETKFDFYDMSFKHLDIKNGHPNAERAIDKPISFEKMKEISKLLSQDIPQVRIDLYDINGKIYFGEMTMFHWSGIESFEPKEWDTILGSWIDLSEL